MAMKIGVIGLGNAGGQVAELAQKNGFDALAINVSEDDTRTLEEVDTIIIGNSMGSGKNRDVAKRYGKNSIKEILSQDKVTTFANDNQIVFVVYSTGGGTGAALGPMMTAVLKTKFRNDDASKRTRFISVGILPSLSESLQAQENTISTLKELASFDGCYALYDNGHFGDLPMEAMMQKINTAIVEDLKVIRGDYNLLSRFTQIDPQDMLNIMSFNGMFRIASAVGFQAKDLDRKSIEGMLLDDIANGAACEIERDRIVRCMAPIVNISPDISEKLNLALPEVQKVVGEPSADFSHYYVIGPADEHLKNRVHVIMTGLSVPDDRLKKIVQRIEEAKAAMFDTKKSSVLSSFGETENAVGKATKESADSDIDAVLDMF